MTDGLPHRSPRRATDSVSRSVPDSPVSTPHGASHSAAPDDDAAHSIASTVAVRRQGRQAWVRVTGEVTALARRHLDDWLDWLITTGADHVSVSLPTAEHLDEACLRVLRMAKVRLSSRSGELIVTAGRAQVRAALSWAGRSRVVAQPRAAHHRPDATADASARSASLAAEPATVT